MTYYKSEILSDEYGGPPIPPLGWKYHTGTIIIILSFVALMVWAVIK